MKRDSFWTEAKIAALRELDTDKTLSRAEMGRLLGTSKGSVTGKLMRLGAEKRPNPVPEYRGQKPRSKTKPAPLPALASLTVSGAVSDVPPDTPPLLPTPRTVGIRVPAEHTCQRIVNDARPWRYCGVPVERGRSYCPACAERVFQRKPAEEEATA
jgi:hypothetical protein